MDTLLLNIEAKCRQSTVHPVNRSDFQVKTATVVSPEIVLTHCSPYCLDHANQKIIFVKTQTHDQLIHEPFLYQAQYEQATQLIAMPYQIFNQLTQEYQIQDDKLFLTFSVGRCGSTLVSRLFHESAGISFSEPDIFTQIQLLKNQNLMNTFEINQLIENCVKILCLSYPSHPHNQWMLKFRSFGLELLENFVQVFPNSPLLFITRKASPWVDSMIRAFRLEEPDNLIQARQFMELIIPAYRQMLTHAHSTTDKIEILTYLWIVKMRCLRKIEATSPHIKVIGYENWENESEETVSTLFEFWGVPLTDITSIQDILNQDSQAGSRLARSSIQSSKPHKKYQPAIVSIVNQYAPELASEIE